MAPASPAPPGSPPGLLGRLRPFSAAAAALPSPPRMEGPPPFFERAEIRMYNGEKPDEDPGEAPPFVSEPTVIQPEKPEPFRISMQRPRSGQVLRTFSHYSDADLLPYPWGLARTAPAAPPGIPRALPVLSGLAGRLRPTSARVEADEGALADALSGEAQHMLARTIHEQPYHATIGPETESVSDALAELPPGSRVMLLPGLYTQTIVIAKEVALYGPGLLGAGVAEIETRGAPAILCTARRATLNGLVVRALYPDAKHAYVPPTVDPAADPADPKADLFAVRIVGGTVGIENCSIGSDMTGAVLAAGGAAVDLVRSFVHGGEGIRKGFVGVRVLDSSAHLEELEIANTGRIAVEIGAKASVKVERSRLRQGNGCGVFVCKDGRGALIDNKIWGFEDAGIYVEGGSQRGEEHTSGRKNSARVWGFELSGGHTVTYRPPAVIKSQLRCSTPEGAGVPPSPRTPGTPGSFHDGRRTPDHGYRAGTAAVDITIRRGSVLTWAATNADGGPAKGPAPPVRITGNALWNNGVGIEMIKEVYPLLVGNSVLNSKGIGFKIIDCGAGTITDNVAKGNLAGEMEIVNFDEPAEAEKRLCCAGGETHFLQQRQAGIGLRPPAPYWRE